MKEIIFSLLIIVTCLYSCSKKEKSIIPTSTTSTTGTSGATTNTGSVSGMISPIRAVKTITVLFLKTGTTYSCTADTVTGAFSLANLPEGNYKIDFSTDPHYNGLASVNTVVTAGRNTDVGKFTTKEANFYLSYEINGTFEGWLFKGYYSSTLFNIGPLSIGTYPEDMRTAYYPSITLDGLTGPGTYTCKGASKSKITYSGYRLGNGFRISYQSTEYAGGEGTVVITSIDPNNRTIKGTFTATLTSASGNAADSKTIKNGLINATY
ncbi:carboxypeptidase regulatory-like domain-containing protein [Mucilaginibacter robiniae]|uniref:Carboxypeptidase regulatory-like domain-containing protein n=1 Tax=Mucilaginibacter robiniae TaxID=2728022 RepID=A0A7L5DV79_9SPHI|nr:carboxypeptidase-like regulatory domain-containing protein [Mucilaginibacter robiniae]QJD95000.1 carboxypeptidase regulatory-like domain-containing protein [Mucilaginibacter robiniae]